MMQRGVPASPPRLRRTRPTSHARFPVRQVIANGRRIGDGARWAPTTAASCDFNASISAARLRQDAEERRLELRVVAEEALYRLLTNSSKS